MHRDSSLAQRHVEIVDPYGFHMGPRMNSFSCAGDISRRSGFSTRESDITARASST